jgi:hypothetical protein
MPWQRCTPAFPKPIPAKEDASLRHDQVHGRVVSVHIYNKDPVFGDAVVCKGDVQHLSAGFWIVMVFRDFGEIRDCRLESPQGEDVGDRVAPLVRWSKNWVRRSGVAFGISMCEVSVYGQVCGYRMYTTQ